jgi:FMN-dependent NADH-azoreductase
MPKLLKIEVSPRGDHSYSRQLAQQFVEQWEKTHSGGEVVVRDLVKTDLPYIELPWIMAAYTDSATHSSEQKAALEIGYELIAELKTADEYLLSTPMYNFNLPAKLKAYIDHIVRSGHTFQVNKDGSYSGLLEGKKATVIIASAGDYKPGTPAAGMDAETPYLKSILGFVGVTDVQFIQAGGTWKVHRGIQKPEEFLAELSTELTAAASR